MSRNAVASSACILIRRCDALQGSSHLDEATDFFEAGFPGIPACKLRPRASPHLVVFAEGLLDGCRELLRSAGEGDMRPVGTQCGERGRDNRLSSSQVLEDLEGIHRPRVLVDEEGNRADGHRPQELGKPIQVRRAEKVDVLERSKRAEVEISEDGAHEDDRPLRMGTSDEPDELSIEALVDLSHEADDRPADRAKGRRWSGFRIRGSGEKTGVDPVCDTVAIRVEAGRRGVEERSSAPDRPSGEARALEHASPRPGWSDWL